MMTETTSAGGMRLEDLRQRREEIMQVAAAHGASNIRVFGSVARGQASDASDIDVLVDLTVDAGGFAYFGALEDLRRALENLLESLNLVRQPYFPPLSHSRSKCPPAVE